MIAIGVVLGVSGGLAAQSNTFPSSGNVGIGTTNPGMPLDVIGAIRDSGGLLMWGGGSLTIQWNNGGDPTDQRFSEFIAQGGIFTGRFVNDAYNAASSWLQVYRNPGTYTVSAVTFPSGNVGIGTTTPLHKLTINDGTGDSSSNSALLAIEGASNKAAIRLLKAYNVEFTAGIDTSNDLRIVNTNGSIDLSNSSNGITMTSTGLVGVGTTNPTYALSVNGTVQAKEVIVQTGWSDYVFGRNYRLAPLASVEYAIKTTQHLPGMPTAVEVAKHGADVGKTESLLLAKVEELTLYAIQQQHRLDAQDQAMRAQNARIERLERENAELRAPPANGFRRVNDGTH